MASGWLHWRAWFFAPALRPVPRGTKSSLPPSLLIRSVVSLTLQDPASTRAWGRSHRIPGKRFRRRVGCHGGTPPWITTCCYLPKSEQGLEGISTFLIRPQIRIRMFPITTLSRLGSRLQILWLPSLVHLISHAHTPSQVVRMRGTYCPIVPPTVTSRERAA